MATEMQKRAVMGTLENIGRDKPLPKGEILRQAGYSEAVVKNPEIVLESKGFQELLDLYLPEDKLLKALNEDIDKKPQNRLGEIKLAMELRGRTRDAKDGPKVVNYNFFNADQLRKVAARAVAGDTAGEESSR